MKKITLSPASTGELEVKKKDSPLIATPASIAKVEQKVENEPRFVNDGRFVLLDTIPTEYRFYDFKQLWIRPFSTSEAKLIYMAKKSGNLTYLISAVAACLSKDIFSLAIQDFEYCLYWLRLNSYPKKPFRVEWTCDNVPAVIRDELISDKPYVDNTEGLECSYKNLSTLSMTNMIIETFPEDIEIPEDLRIPPMQLFEEVWEMNKKLLLYRKSAKEGKISINDDDLINIEGAAYIIGLAQWINEGDTLKDKVTILESQQNFDLQDSIEELLSKLTEFGVSESVTVTCQKCGGTSRRKLVLDYISFFP